MQSNKPSTSKTLLLALSALGIVFGDIGTSPLYAVKEIVFHLGSAGREPTNVFGFTSIVLWALIIIISLKYVVLVLRADNHGEGGVFALYALLQKVGDDGKILKIVSLFLLLGVGMLFGDGIITPAISVISAVEGLAVITTKFDPFIIPITVGILTSLFMIQGRGTHSIGRIFGPIIALWFLSISLLGLPHIIANPQIFLAFNPQFALNFLLNTDPHTIFLVLGSVMLVVTGGEALYADMGHFSRLPIRISWFSIAFPALLLNYLGQGAFLLGSEPIVNHNIFFSMAPSWAVGPLVLFATAATIIASQALITGAFSLAIQGIALGLFPMLRVKHTHAEHAGQIYVPVVNQALYFGSIFLVVLFKSSSNLASAYGLAVSSVMLITTIAVFFISRKSWNWPLTKALFVFVPLAFIDLVFFIASSFKFLQGGFIPLVIGLGILAIMLIWRWGKAFTRNSYSRIESITIKELIELKKRTKSALPRTFFIMTPYPPSDEKSSISVTGQVILDRYGLVPFNMVFIHVKIHEVPYMDQDRYQITNFYSSSAKGNITGVVLNYGFIERPRVEAAIEELARKKLIPVHEDRKLWTVHALKKRFFFFQGMTRFHEIIMHLYRKMYFESKSADEYYGLGNRIRLNVSILPVKTKH